MAFNKALIPLYINTSILNNLFAVVVQEFIAVRSLSIKDQIQVHLKTPVSEISYDLFGKYIQGDLDIQIQNEFVKQRTEERISTVIIILKELKDILAAQGLLKSINPNSPFEGIEENDYVEFSCELKRNPIINNMINAINILQVGNTVDERTIEESVDSINSLSLPISNIKKAEMLNYLKSSLENYKQERCLRYLAENIDGTGVSAMVPMKTSSFLDNEDYLLNGKVRVLGKVVRMYNNYAEYKNDETAKLDDSIFHPVMNDAFFDNIDFNQISQINCPCLRHKPALNNIDLKSMSRYPKYEILPIATYI